MDIEQRKYPRFSVQGDAFAALGSGIAPVGKVKDISIKGLALSYLSESIIPISYRKFSQVCIFLKRNGFYLPKVPCKIVYDIQDSKSIKNSSISKYRCGLHFGKLSRIQLELLELFIGNYTTGLLLSSS